MNLRHVSAAVALAAIVTGAGCSSQTTTPKAATSPTTSKPAAASKWTDDEKTSVRQLMAMAAVGQQLDCAVQVVTETYTPDDWTYLVAHMNQTDEPSALKDKDDQSAKTMESRCGIKDTRAEDKAKADAEKAYNAAVDEWNALTDAQRDGFNGYSDWAAKNGKPTSFN